MGVLVLKTYMQYTLICIQYSAYLMIKEYKMTVMYILELRGMSRPAPMPKNGSMGQNKVRWVVLPTPSFLGLTYAAIHTFCAY